MERMQSISPECNELKYKYDDCFNSWFSERFLRGDSKDPCKELLEAYQTCVKKQIEKTGIKVSEVEQNYLGTEKDKSKSHPGGKKVQ